MAESVKASGRLLGNEMFEFSLDGIATASQMERLIKLTAEYTDKITKGKSALAKAEREHVEAVIDLTDATEEATKATTKSTQTSVDFRDAINDLGKSTSFFKGHVQSATYGMKGFSVALTTGVGTLYGALSGYADQLQAGLQRGVSGGIMDFAIAAKTGGVTLGQFSKALEESGGGFASLGAGATMGAKEFGGLISSVREATAGVGNMGLSNEQLAMFTAQQTKTAISQGFKGKQAQDVVIRNSRALGNELDTLANRTGKSVLELTQAAMKLAQDPIVANFVQTTKVGGAEVSKAVQQFGASLRGVFGEAGDAIASDVLKTALGNLPLVITQTGKNMIMASSAVYSELERQARIVKAGGNITAQDQEKLRDTVLREVKARGSELRMLANLEGQAGDSARQLLALAEQANFYNSAEGAQRREEDKRAQAFNSAMNQLKANMIALSIPFLKLINNIPWDYFIKTLNVFVDTLSFLMRPFAKIGQIFSLGFDTFGVSLGSAIAVILGLVSAVVVAKTGIELLAKVFTSFMGETKTLSGAFKGITSTTDLFKKAMERFVLWAREITGKPVGGLGGTVGTEKPGPGETKKKPRYKPGPDGKPVLVTEPAVATTIPEAKPIEPKPAVATTIPEAKPIEPKPATTITDKAKDKLAAGAEKFNASKTGKLAGKIGGNPLSWIGGAALDYGSEYAKKEGQQGLGAGLSVASGALSGAAMGALIGSFVPVIGTAVGGAVGGVLGGVSSLVGEISEWNKMEEANSLSEVGSEAVSQSNKVAQAQVNELREIKQAIYQQQNEASYGNSLGARQVALQDATVRAVRAGQYYNLG
jgi:hypothetical protein